MADETPELERLRQKFGLSRREISDLIGASEMSVFRWSRGLTKPHPHLQKKLDVLVEVLKKAEVKNE